MWWLRNRHRLRDRHNPQCPRVEAGVVDAAVKLVRGAAVVFRNTRVNLRQKMCSHAASLYTTRNALRVMPPICAAF